MVHYGRSQSLKVTEIGADRKPICDVLLVFHYNYVPIFYRCGDVTIDRKYTVLPFLPTPGSFESLARGVSPGSRVRKLIRKN